MQQLSVFLHLVGVIVWVGGMFFAHFCMRPAALALQPPQRLPLMAGALGRFFAWVLAALVLIWASGLAMMVAVGFGASPRAWHAMMGVGLVMTVVFAAIRLLHYPRLQAGVAAGDWPAAAAALNRIRQLVAVNLGLGFLTVAIATLGRIA
jgi:uncharacterized membrane protein